MAHQTRINRVPADIHATNEEQNEIVLDPVCGKELKRRESRNMVFRETGTYYFCSKDCQATFLSPSYKPQSQKPKAA